MGETKKELDSERVVLIAKELLRLLCERQIQKNWETKKSKV